MTPEQWRDVKRVLAGALERTPSERSAYLDMTCSDATVRSEVESGLATQKQDDARTLPGSLTATTQETLRSGSRLGPYEIAAQIGAGGMGVVYRARDHRLERDVAIKLFPLGVQVDEVARKRFRKEALALAKLSHPNIAAVYDIGDQDGTEYLVMEYVAGQSLADRVKSGPFSVREAVSLAREVARALEEAHEQGIVHRDLKPGNIMVTPKGHAKVLDFGLAKLLVPEAVGDSTLSASETVGLVGTPLYMSPEQAQGGNVDERSDLWSLGVVLYEMLTIKRPFAGSRGGGVLRAIVEQDPKPIRELRPDVPKEVESVVVRAMEKDASKRYQTAVEMSAELASVLAHISSPALPLAPRELRVPFRYALSVAAVVAILLGSGAWTYRRYERRQWASDKAIPEITKLQEGRQFLAAFLLTKEAEQYLPGDARLAQLESRNSQVVSIASSPSGANIEIKDYLSPKSDWYSLGTTPLSNVQIPAGYLRWRVSKPGVGEYISAPLTTPQMKFQLDAEMAAPDGMSFVSGQTWVSYIGFVGLVGPYRLPPFYIDRYEVTNRQYQEFVDNGGYQKREFWKEPFVRDARKIGWDQALAFFRDSTGRPGPSTWVGGHYPPGQENYPVSGVSWYEAAAYAAYAGKSLPAFAQWYAAAPPDAGDYIAQVSNVSLSGSQSNPAPVGKYQGLGPYGTYDMAGNVSEWVLNPTTESSYFILGGDSRAPSYAYSDPQALSPWDRSRESGFRCVRNTAPLAEEIARAVQPLQRDFTTFKPASDQVFHAYQALYMYDNAPLDARSEGTVQETADWREEKITFDTAYDNQRMAAYLFVPKNVRPPYQAIIFSPSARVLYLHDSRNLGDIKFFDYVIQSGRAVLYPVLYGTYERQEENVSVGAAQELSYFAKRSKDIGRSLDYLASRPDIDKDKIAYLGVSMGAAEGVIYTAIAQSRLKTVILLDGGYFLGRPPTGGDQADFAPRLKLPVLMVNGKDDYVFSVEKSQDPLFRMLGTPNAEKQHILLDTSHDVTDEHTRLVKAVLDWLDKFLGRVS